MGLLDELTTQKHLNSAIDEFCMERRLNGVWTKKSAKGFDDHFKRFRENVGVLLGKEDPPLKEITKMVVLQHLKLVEQGRRGKPSPQMKQASFRVIRAFFNWCLESDQGFIEVSPIPHKYKIGKVDEKHRDLPTKDHLRIMINALDDSFLGKRNKAIIMCLANTGCRRSELMADADNDRVGLQNQDIDWENRTIKVFGKGRVWREVGIQPNTAKYMFTYRQAVQKKFPIRTHDSFWITEEGRPLAASGFWEFFHRLCKKLGYHFTLHDWRRFFTTLALEANMNHRSVMALTGHKSEHMLKVYSKEYAPAAARKQLEIIAPVSGI